MRSSDPSGLLLDRFLEFVQAEGLTLYPAQEEAILTLLRRENLILNTPTGSGKSLVAEAQVFFALAKGESIVLTYPIKALANEKFKRLRNLFGENAVGLATGDMSLNSDAPVLVCTAEILAQISLSEAADRQPLEVVVDEFHYFGDRDRGVWWQIPLLLLSSTRFTLMSATLGDVARFESALTRLNDLPTRVVSGFVRPVPLEFEYRTETALHETIKDLIELKRAPIYLVSFSQGQAFDEAQNAMSVDLISKEQKQQIAKRLEKEQFRTPQGKLLNRYLRHGIGVHHAGLLPHYRALVEELAQLGLLALISGTDTLGVGVNVPIRTVLLTGLAKYDGQKAGLLKVREFHQIAGRAGRRGFDSVGYVVVQDPAHEIENRKLKRKAATHPSKNKKVVLTKPPERGFVPWSQATFEKLIQSEAEPLQSQFRFEFSVVIFALRSGAQLAKDRLRRLLKDNFETPGSKKRRELITRLFQILRHLNAESLITLKPLALAPELQSRFALNEGLSAWLLEAISAPEFISLDDEFAVLSLVEATVESPEVVLNKQRARARNELFHQLRQEGLDREVIQDRLEEVEHPKPLAELIYPHFNAWVSKHPWIDASNVRPKSIAREMLESAMSFNAFVKEYGIERFEGVLYRYLKNLIQVLRSGIPKDRLPALTQDFIVALESELKFIDVSLKASWEQQADESKTIVSPTRGLNEVDARLELKNQNSEQLHVSGQTHLELDAQWVRVNLFRFLSSWSRRDWDLGVELLVDLSSESAAWSFERIAFEFGTEIDSAEPPQESDWVQTQTVKADVLERLYSEFFIETDREQHLLLTPTARAGARGRFTAPNVYVHRLYERSSGEPLGVVWVKLKQQS